MAKKDVPKMYILLVAIIAFGAVAYLYETLGWGKGMKIDNATYAKRTLAESGPYAVSINAIDSISEQDKRLVEEKLLAFCEERGFSLVDPQAAVDGGGSVLTVFLDRSRIDPRRSTFAVDFQVMTYVYRETASGNFYRQSASIYTSGKHGHATNDVFGEAISQTTVMMAGDFLDQYERDNP
ncbi:MAG: hypothetical protein ACPGYV_10650 [Phycisphaeraceae bacterium]